MYGNRVKMIVVKDGISLKRVDRLPDKTIVLLSSGNYVEQGFTIKRIELRLYQEKTGGKAGPYSIITIHIETDKGIIERVFDEGFRGPNALEEATAYLTSHLTLSDLILQSVLKLQKHLKEQNK